MSVLDERRERWLAATHQYDVPHLRLRAVAEVLRQLKPRCVVDLGCGPGRLRNLCPEVEYHGVDFVRGESAREFSFHPCDLNRDPLPNVVGLADVVVCSGVLEYVEQLPLFAVAIHEKMKNKSVAIISYFNMNHVSRIVGLACGKGFAVHPDWRGFYAPAEVERLFGDAGFVIERSYALGASLQASRAVEETLEVPLRLREAHWSSRWWAHQFIHRLRKT